MRAYILTIRCIIDLRKTLESKSIRKYSRLT